MKADNIDFTGKRFGKLSVIRKTDEKTKYGGAIWICHCECGNEIKLSASTLRNGYKRDCGCEPKPPKTTKEILHRTWRHMKERCNSQSCKSYKNYGQRGINVCEEWQDKNNGFKNFYDWSLKNGYEKGLTLDRIDSNKGYYPENCRWATYETQNNNTRRNHMLTYNGTTQTMAQWAREVGLSYNTLDGRIFSGKWTVEEALTTPTLHGKREKYR